MTTDQTVHWKDILCRCRPHFVSARGSRAFARRLSASVRARIAVWVIAVCLGAIGVCMGAPGASAQEPERGDGPAAPEPVPAGTVVRELPNLRGLIGEEATFDGRITVAGVTLKVGTATCTVTEETEPEAAVVLQIVASGGALGYSTTATARTVLEPESCRPIQFVTSREGSENKAKRLDFEPGKICYIKLKHCHDPACRNPAHMVPPKSLFNLPSVATGMRHCDGCDDPRHSVWRLLYTHEVQDDPFLDLLTAFYMAREGGFEPGRAFTLPVVEDRDRWHVIVSVGKPEKVTVEAGTFDCVTATLKPVNVGDPKRQDRFSGLFGMKGDLKFWIDRRTHVPVRITGVLPFAFLELDCEVRLTSLKQPWEKDGAVRTPSAPPQADKADAEPKVDMPAQARH